MKNHILIFIFAFIATGKTNAQNYPVSAIPDDLKQGAYAVVRELSEEFLQNDLYNGTYKVTYVATILNNKGDSYANFRTYEDRFRELTDFSGEVFNSSGQSVKKIKKKDLTTTGFSQHLATDGKNTFYDLHSPVYPFTVKYSYKIKFKNGILSYPFVAPIRGFHIAVEKADYSLKIPSEFTLREKKRNTNIPTIETKENGSKTYTYSVRHLKALDYEPYTVADELLPIIYLSPEKFCAEKICGNSSSWEDFGLWFVELLKGRDSLSKKDVDKVIELTKDAKTVREKAKILYHYFQSTTHYVSIQLGIGGWQPIATEEVAKTGFGDCKALSNYMKALLSAAGIPSYYTIIRSDEEKKRLMRDFPNFSQNNHAILTVPLENDTVWLECTSQTLPFGYTHSSIAGHDALIIRENDAVFSTLPDTPTEKNRETNSVDIQLTDTGDATMKVRSCYEMQNFKKMYFRMYGMTSEEQTNFLGSLLRVPKPQITAIQKQETFTESPVMELSYRVDCEEYAQKTGSRFFFLVNPIHTKLRSFGGKSRQHDIVFHSNFNETDTIRFLLPKNYRVENKLKPIEFSSAYGSFKSEIEEKDGTLLYIQQVRLLSGRFSASEYGAIKDFYEKIELAQNTKIALKREE